MSRSESILSIHIEDDFLSIVHLGRSADGLRLFASHAVPLQEGLVKEGQILNTVAVSQKIRHFVKSVRPKPQKVIMLPSCTAVRLKPSQFPQQTKAELKKLVEDQIAGYTLFGNKEIVFDYCVFASRNADTQTVLEAVTTRRISDGYLELVRLTRLPLIRIEPAVMPIMKLILDNPPSQIDDVSLLLALESNSGNISVFKNDRPHLCRNLTIGLKDVLSATDGTRHLQEKLNPVLEFARSIADSERIVLKVTAACSGDKLSEIVNRIKSAFNAIKVEQINPVDVIQHLGIKGADKQHPPIFAFIGALAELDIYKFKGQLNLISHDSINRQETRNEVSLLTKCIIAVILLSIAATYPIEMKLKSVEASSAQIEGKIAETIPMKRKVASIKKQIKQLKERKSVYAAACGMLTDTPWSQILRDIAENIPNEVRILDISSSIDSADFVVVGQALAEGDVYSFAKKLQKSDFIDTTKVEQVEYGKEGGATLLNYKITCKIHLAEGNL